MIFIFDSIVIILYLINGYLGAVAMTLFSMWIWYHFKCEKILRIYILMCVSLPFSYIGILGTQQFQMISWYNIYIVLYMLYFLKSRYIDWQSTAKTFLYVSGIFILLLINLLYTPKLAKPIIEIVQMFVMIIPISLSYSIKKTITVSSDNYILLTKTYIDSCCAAALALIFQYFAYKVLSVKLGYITFYGGNRVNYLCLFKGESIFPIFIGIGALMLLYDFMYNKVEKLSVIKLCMIIIAMILSNSRAGIVSFFVVAGYMIIRYIYKKKNLLSLCLAIVGIFAAYKIIDYITASRNLSGIMNLNGRKESYIMGLQVWKSSIKNVILGDGFTRYVYKGVETPHNMVIQLLAQCGVIVAVLIVAGIIAFYIKNRKSQEKYLIIYIVVANMMVTDFYANAFTTVVFIMIAFTSNYKKIITSKIVNKEIQMSDPI